MQAGEIAASDRPSGFDERKRVLAYLTMLRARLGTWTLVEQSLPFSHSTRVEITEGRAEVSAALAFRVAKFMGVSIAAILDGSAFPPGTCKRCGRAQDE